MDKLTRNENEKHDWRVSLLRALVEGDIDIVKRDVTMHVEALFMPFTQGMERWKLEWESKHWWLLEDAGCVFIAALYAHSHIVRWLLEFGADRYLRCFLNQTAADMVGECSNNHKGIEECKWLLKEPPSVPEPPTSLKFEFHLTADEVTDTVELEENGHEVEKVVRHKSFVSNVLVSWSLPKSNGSMIRSYEIKYRIADASLQKGTEWRTESTTHLPKEQTQGLCISKLFPATKYLLAVRSQNVSGTGEWGQTHEIETPPAPIN